MLGPDWRLGYLFVLPIVVLVLALVAYPFCYAIYLSMTRKFVGMPPVFVGLENYIRLASDGFFQRAVWNSVIFTFGSVIFKLVLGMAMALVLTSKIRFRNLFTGILLIPWVAPTVVSALNFLWIYDAAWRPDYVLVKVWHPSAGCGLALRGGDGHGRGDLRKHLARFPFFGISFLAGIKAIPASSTRQRRSTGQRVPALVHVTLPGSATS